MKRSRAALAAFLVAVTGCPVGTMAKSFPPAQEPRGIQAQIRLHGSAKALPVELLALEDTAVIALWHPPGQREQLVILPLRSIESANCPAASHGSLVREGAYAPPDARSRLTLLARYPQGISPELMALLLGDYGQPALVTLPSGGS